eukprot:CAMPEP_0113713304 /NCGR_PEP_ID=MMETSP0038_2-20120614/31922_1 /TAXON_ID=2898 /ORGANISM="Cryptomonas paramecium" /LENGTH=95 /DNA_ID=CAMNT_0000640025 /DNA_START=41 /DNA_END=324 /DNA_ORIENTATION=+ /assembly_acc=CAM_ASM_000170
MSQDGSSMRVHSLALSDAFEDDSDLPSDDFEAPSSGAPAPPMSLGKSLASFAQFRAPQRRPANTLPTLPEEPGSYNSNIASPPASSAGPLSITIP